MYVSYSQSNLGHLLRHGAETQQRALVRVLCTEPLGEIQFAVVELSTKLDYESW